MVVGSGRRPRRPVRRSRSSQGAGRRSVGDQPGIPARSRDRAAAPRAAVRIPRRVPRTSRPLSRGIERRRPGAVIAVWGPTGAPGRSTVAMGIADEAAAAGHAVILIDADVYGGVLAAAFGLLDESPGLAGACRMASNGRLDGADPDRAVLGARSPVLAVDRHRQGRPVAGGAAVGDPAWCSPWPAGWPTWSWSTARRSWRRTRRSASTPWRRGATARRSRCWPRRTWCSRSAPGIRRESSGWCGASSQLAEAVPEASPRVVVNRTRRSAASAREIDDAISPVHRTRRRREPSRRPGCHRQGVATLRRAVGCRRVGVAPAAPGSSPLCQRHRPKARRCRFDGPIGGATDRAHGRPVGVTVPTRWAIRRRGDGTRAPDAG